MVTDPTSANEVVAVADPSGCTGAAPVTAVPSAPQPSRAKTTLPDIVPCAAATWVLKVTWLLREMYGPGCTSGAVAVVATRSTRHAMVARLAWKAPSPGY